MIDLTTPALLFGAISLLLLAYTNRFIALANVIRKLHADYREDRDVRNLQQITNLRHRVRLIRRMQEAGVASFFFCVSSMLAIFLEATRVGEWLFGLSLALLCLSLLLSVLEVHQSVVALDIHLSDLEDED